MDLFYDDNNQPETRTITNMEDENIIPLETGTLYISYSNPHIKGEIII